MRALAGSVGMLVMATGIAYADQTALAQGASEVATTFLEELGEAMTQEMTERGPVEAIILCTKLAPDIAGRLSREHGWRVTRVGTRVRNPLLGMPDAWEQRVLAEFAERAAKGKTFASMTHHEVVTEPDGQYFRFMKPIMVQSKCLLCHGSREQIPESIRIMLKQQYPFDRAIGYMAGELRGAVSIKQPLDNARGGPLGGRDQ
ncbi:MAG TPA: DUF3365 domain-containing protein [Nitrospiraceae bacterium]|nr:DUF3365 domain-containing protein [Nitrospiraceae bacterium]